MLLLAVAVRLVLLTKKPFLELTIVSLVVVLIMVIIMITQLMAARVVVIVMVLMC